MGLFDNVKNKINQGADAINNAKKSMQKGIGASVSEDEIRSHFMEGEELLQSITQTIIANVKTIVLTNTRLLIIEKQLTKSNFSDFRWGYDISDVHFSESMTSGKFVISFKSGKSLTIDNLKKDEAKEFYKKCQAVEQSFLDFEHKREVEKAKAGAIQIGNIPGNNDSKSDIKAKLKELKELFDDGLIDENEYKDKKDQLLKSM